MNPNPKMKAAIKEAEEAKAKIAETINSNTAAQIELLLSIKNKVEKSQINEQVYTVKLTSDEAGAMWGVCQNLVYAYWHGTDHVCEYDKTTFNCIVCGDSL
jgi:regulator of replication initiation timing